MQNPIVTIETNQGVIKVELYPETAPNTVNNFISLVRKGFYDGTIFHRVKHTTGVISMARSQKPDSAGSQFFIMVADAAYLDGQYAAFGKVTEGQDVANAIAHVDRDRDDRPDSDQIMEKVTVETFGEEYPEPKVGPEY